MIKTVSAVRYVTPLREGGSLPAIVEADDGQMYVLKFVGAGQGPKALIAELVVGEIGRALQLPVPEIVLMEVDPVFGSNEPNDEIQDLLYASAGLNLAMGYLPQATSYNPLLTPPPDALLASSIVWLDAYTFNVDRTPYNTNLLVWQAGLWLIDHGAALYFHHAWNGCLQPEGRKQKAGDPFAAVKNHVLLDAAGALRQADELLRPRLTPVVIAEIVAAIPDAWLDRDSPFAGYAEHRAAYVELLAERLQLADAFVEEAVRARDRAL